MPKNLKKNLEFWLWFVDKGFKVNEDCVKILRGDLVQCLDLVNDIERWNNVVSAIHPSTAPQSEGVAVCHDSSKWTGL